jgi:2-keto-4-pentenoate hydratase/2-oxohepta-3-ene-1,7-dioic acid hydratase in catechol pathway
MTLSLVRFQSETHWRWGVRQGDRLLSHAAWAGLSTGEIVGLGLPALRAAAGGGGCTACDLSQVRILPPITRHQQLTFQVGNYRSHLREVGVSNPDAAPNVFFSKAVSALTGPQDALRKPVGVRLLDYEVELGLVMGRHVDRPVTVAAQQLSQFVAGLVLVNDISARDAQIADGQYFHSKSHRGFCPVGPYLVLLDESEFALVDQLQLRLWVNGELRQSSSVRDMVHPPPAALTHLSAAIDLHPGDLIATGTPGGCAIRAPKVAIQKLLNLLPDRVKLRGFIAAQARSGRYLKAGDVVTAAIATPNGEIDLGIQRTEVLA